MARSKTEFRTPLARVSGLGSAKDGTGHWWYQRLTAVALVPLVLAFSMIVLRLAGRDHAAATAALRNPVAVGIGALLVAVGFWHLQLGARVIIEDYVHREGAKIALIVASAFACATIAFACLFALAKLAFGA
jgi:succinate dehydrogenase / fumarate reductase, membrane anchor subunit